MLALNLLAVVLLAHSAFSLESPCIRNNVTLMSSTTFKALVGPKNCGRVQLNESEFLHPPSVILHGSGTDTKNKYSIMLLKEKPNLHDVFELKWLLANISPLSNSLTSNLTRTDFLAYIPPKTNGTSKYWLLVFKQETTHGFLRFGHKQEEINEFFPQKWIERNKDHISGRLAGGVEFYLVKNRPVLYYTTPRTPHRHMTWAPPSNPQYPHYPQPPQRTDYPRPISPPAPLPNYPQSNVSHNDQIHMVGMNRTNQTYAQNGTYHNHTGSYYPPNPGYQPPLYPQPPPGSSVHHHYHESKGKKGGASAISAFFPLVAALAWATSQFYV